MLQRAVELSQGVGEAQVLGVVHRAGDDGHTPSWSSAVLDTRYPLAPKLSAYLTTSGLVNAA
jgi:hypothetical protein